jgi:sugar phosphate isomerase/epimerase
MQLAFVSAILADLSLDDVLRIARELQYDAVELMCWPRGKAERRYAGVTHVDVSEFGQREAKAVRELCARNGVGISGLGYYPNPLSPDQEEASLAVSHLRRVIDAAALLEVGVVNSFIGRDPKQSIEENWPRVIETWRPLVEHAAKRGVRIGIENCAMLFTADEWPGGKNLATTPAIWRRLFADIPQANFGLNLDPSHLIWLHIDPAYCVRSFADRIVHVHAKDVRIDHDRLNEHGILGYPNAWHTPKLPGQGDVRWGPFLGALADARYHGPVAVEVEDRAYEGPLEKRIESLAISRNYLAQYIGTCRNARSISPLQ